MSTISFEPHTFKFHKTKEWVAFALIASHAVEECDIHELQRKAGYDPMGYGVYAFKCEKVTDNEYLISWKCSSTC